MRYRQLGSSDLHVSAVSLGTWKTYGGGRVPPEPQLGITVSQLALAWVLREENAELGRIFG